MNLSDVEGFILAGGMSRRMGTPKALLEIEGETILERIARTLGEVFSTLRIVTDRNQEVDFVGLPIVPDQFRGSGPLGGLHASLNHARGETIFLVSCDLPFISSRLIRSLWNAHGNAVITVPSVGGRVQPLCGFYSKTLLGEVEGRLRKGVRAMRPLLSAADAQILPLDLLRDPMPDWHLLNINTPHDLAQALALSGGSSETVPALVRSSRSR